MKGPLELLVIVFDGHEVRSEIVRAFDAVRSHGNVRIVDLLFVTKSPTGEPGTLEIADLDRERAAMLGIIDTTTSGEVALGWFAKDDIESVVEEMPEGSIAALILIEHTWAEALREAAALAQGRMVMDGRIGNELAEKVEGLIGRGDPHGIYATDDRTLRRAEMIRRRGLGLVANATHIPIADRSGGT